jgi:hypothetical protein
MVVSGKDRQIHVREASIKITASAEAKQAAEKAVQQERLAKETIQKAAADRARAIAILSGGSKKSGRMRLETIRMLSGGSATQESIANMMRSEIRIINGENISMDQKQEKFQKVKTQYEKLLTFAQSRSEQTKINIEKMKKSKDPNRQAAGFDIEIALNQAEQNSFKSEIDRYNALIQAGINEEGKPLKQPEHEEYKLTITKLTEKQKQLQNEIDGTEGKDGLKKQRENIPGSGNIPNVIKEMAVALTPEVGNVKLDGEQMAGEKAAAEIEKAQEDPVGYIEDLAANALTSTEGMKTLEDRLVTANLMSAAEKAQFEKFMKLGLTAEEQRALIAKKGGQGLLGLSGIMGLLAYLSWKKSQEGGQQQMG